MRRIFCGLSMLFCSALSTAPLYAEDVGVTIATLDDPKAECRYLKDLWDTAEIAKGIGQERLKAAQQALANLPQNRIGVDYYRAKKLQEEAGAADYVWEQKLNNYFTARKIIKVKRGTLSQCTTELPFLGELKEAETKAAEQSKPSLEDRLKELKTLREKNLITPEEYYDKRAKLLEGL